MTATITPTPADYYESYWTHDQTSVRGAKYRSDHGFLTAPLAEVLSAQVSANAEWLDVGCGDGRTAGVWAREHGRRYLGVDVSSEAVKAAQAIGLDARKTDDATALPFPDNSFDVVTCIEVIEHLFLPREAVAEMRRVLRPGGRLIVTTPNVAYWRRRVDMALLGRWNPLGDDLAVEAPWRDPHIRFFNPGSLQRMLKSAGFGRVFIGGHEGSLLADIPVVRKLSRFESQGLYHNLEMQCPSLFGKRLHAIAWK